MTLNGIKTQVAALLATSVTDAMFLQAANNARKHAELLHNFEYARITATLSLAGASGGELEDATITAGSADNGIKEITAVAMQTSDSVLLPLPFSRYDIALQAERQRVDHEDMFWPDIRYPSDNAFVGRGATQAIVQIGTTLKVYPLSTLNTSTVDLQILGYGWLNDYDDSSLAESNPDFIVAHGYEYLQWATLIELNHLAKTFVPRTEGNLTPPEALRDRAWQNLIRWDAYIIDPNITT